MSVQAVLAVRRRCRGLPGRLTPPSRRGSEYALDYGLRMLARLDLENFRAFEREHLNLSPITVFVGPNNSGKSSILASLRLLVQTLQSLDYQVPLLLNGALGDFGTYKDVVFGNDRRHRLQIGLSVRRPAGRRRGRRARAQANVDYWDLEETEASLALKYRYRTRRRELILDEATVAYGDAHLLTLSYSDDAGRHLLTAVAGLPTPQSVRSRVSPGPVDLYHFLPRVYPFFDEPEQIERLKSATSLSVQDSYGVASDVVFYFSQLLEAEVEYVGPMRLPPQRTYQHTGEAHGRVGGRGENWAAILTREMIGGEAAALLPVLEPWLRDAGLASEIELVWLSDRQYEIRVRHPSTGESENIADVGQGNSQVLPVLVGGLHLRAGSLFMVEEPEIHLHPHAQAQLGDFFRDLYRRGVQSLIETHSEYVVLRLQEHVASGQLPPEAVRFYYVDATRDKKNVRELTLDRNGTFENEMPHGFFPQRYLEPRRLARARGEAALKRKQSELDENPD